MTESLRRSLQAVDRAVDLRAATRSVALHLFELGATRCAFYRRSHRGLERLGAWERAGGGATRPGSADAGGGEALAAWDDALHVLAPLPDALTPLFSGAASAPIQTSSADWQLGELAGMAVIRLTAAEAIVGALFVSADALEACGPDTQPLASALGAQIRIAADQSELQRLRELRYEHLVRSETLAATGMLSAGVAHELNNPLGVVVGLAELLVIDEELPPHVREDLQVIVAETSRAVRVVKQLLSYGRSGGVDLEPVDLGELLEGSIAIMEATRAHAPAQIVRSFSVQRPVVMADAFRLQQAILAMLDNARNAVKAPDGRVRVALDPGEDPSTVVVSIADNGPGISDEVMPRIFDPFFTTREVGKGTGMGLALVHRTVRDLGGEISCHNIPGSGACFTITLGRHPVGDRE